MKRIGFIALSFFAPVVAFAQNPDSTQLFAILAIVQNVLNVVIPIVITLGVVYVVYGIIMFVTKTNEEERAKAKNVILYGIIGLFFIVSLWGIIGFIGRTVGVNPGGSSGNALPCVIDTAPATPGCQS
jgi:hypothetical protein